LVEGVALSDPRVMWIREQAAVCVGEGMAPREAVALAWDLAFRRYGQEPPRARAVSPPDVGPPIYHGLRSAQPKEAIRVSDKPKAPPSEPAPRPLERKDRGIDTFRNDVPGTTREKPVATPKPAPQPKRETVRTGPKKAG
jgi:hypothetical protein